MIISTVAKIRLFDEKHNSDNAFENASGNCKMCVWWLIAAQSDNTIDPIPILPYINPIIIAVTKSIHSAKIQSKDTILVPDENTNKEYAFNELTTNIHKQTIVLEKINMLAQKRGEDKRKGIKWLIHALRMHKRTVYKRIHSTDTHDFLHYLSTLSSSFVIINLLSYLLTYKVAIFILSVVS